MLAHNSPAAALDVALAFPRSAGPRRPPARQGGGLPPVELPQLGHVAQDGDGGDEAHARHFVQGVDLFLVVRRIGDQSGQFFFHRLELGFQMFAQLGLLFDDEGIGRVFAVLAGPHLLLLVLRPPVALGAHLQLGGFGVGGGGGLMRVAIRREQGAVQRVAFSHAATTGQRPK